MTSSLGRVSHRTVGEASEAAGVLDHLVGQRRDVVLLLDRLALLRRIAEAAREAGGLDIGMVADPHTGDDIVLRGNAGLRTSALRGVVVPRGLGLGGKVTALLRPVWVPDYVSSGVITHHFDGPVLREGLHAMLSVPLRFHEYFGGVVYVGLRKPANFGDQTIDAVQRVADAGAEQLYVADRLRETTDAAVAAERSRIAVELHDSVGAMLFTVGAQLRDMQTDPGATPQLLDRLRGLEKQIAQTAASFRGSLAALDDTEPCERLHATLTEDCTRFSERTGVFARCVAVTSVPELPPDHVKALVATVREALLNVEKHARASSAVVSVAALDGGVGIAVADDGVGFQPAMENRQDTSSGIGLPAASERLERLGGSLSVVENEDGGLTVRAWLPVDVAGGAL